MNNESVLMTEGSPSRHIIRFAVPLFWGCLFQQLYNVVDALVVGNFLGSDALAAVSSSGNMIELFTAMFIGVFTGAGIVIARVFGARDFGKLTRAVHTDAAAAVISGALLTVIGIAFSPALLRWVGTPASVMNDAVLYFRIYFAGSLFMTLYNMTSGIFQAVGDSRHPLYYLILSACVNIVLDLLFVAVLGMGVDGAALATVLSQGISAAPGLVRLMRTREPYRLEIKKIGIHGETMKQILIMGIPNGMQNSVIGFANTLVQASINLFGAEALAGYGCYGKIEGFAFLPVTAFATAVSTFVGQNLGAGEYERAVRGSRFGWLCGAGLSEALGLMLCLLAPGFIGLFNRNAQVIEYGAMHARIVGPFFFLCATSHIMAGVMRGAGRSVVPMTVILCCWCAIRLLYIFTVARPSGDIRMVYWAYPITWTLSTACFLTYYFKADWPHYLTRKEAHSARPRG